MSEWLELARCEITAGRPCAVLTVTRTEGSTPREAGARMLICEHTQLGTIGGGKLELDAMERARELLAVPGPAELAATHVYNLGASLGQCCGGHVEVLVQRLDRGALAFVERLIELGARREPYACRLVLEAKAHGEVGRIERAIVPREGDAPLAPRWQAAAPGEGRVLLDVEPARGLHVVLFGAGHVGRALVHVLAPLGWWITWVETRDDAFSAGLPANVDTIATDIPEACVDEAPARTAFVIMTHDHALDLRLCERVLARTDFLYCGLIGSRTKRAKFAHRLGARGFSAEAIERIVCPIGLPQLSGKAPFEVAISAAAQLLQVNGGR